MSDIDFKWWDMDYWESGEWQVVKEKLDDLDKAGIKYVPYRSQMFLALNVVRFVDVKVVIIGQDPYPNPEFATGIAFSISEKSKKHPLTLANILKEYSTDLHDPYPVNGCLEKWWKQGVLLWNAYPTCQTNKPASHHWPEWSLLTQEMVTRLSDKGSIVFVLLGAHAQEFSKYIDQVNNDVICLAHPSPRGNLNAKHPFTGSRVFTTINSKLCSQGLSPIDWRLE